MDCSKTRSDILAQIKLIIYKVGGSGADEEYYKGWDAAVDAIDEEVDKLLTPEDKEHFKDMYIDIITGC